MVTINIIRRVFCIRYGDLWGSAFTVDIQGREYLITAKHVVNGIKPRDEIHILENNHWVSTPIRVVGHAKQEIDIIVLALERLLVPPNLPPLKIETGSNGLVYSQDVFFLGFPYVENTTLGIEGFPMPFVKKAIVSYIGKDIYFLDGHGNKGFSGGPVVFGLAGEAPTRIAGVIQGYRHTDEPVLGGDTDKTLMSRHNTGIIISYKIEYALDLIRANPIGFLIK